MTVSSTERSPHFDFVVPEGSQALVDRNGRTIEVGHRFERVSEIPIVARQKDARKLCDAFRIIGYRCVSEKFKTIVESLEPGLHQFFPVALQSKDAAPYDASYFIFNPCVLVDAYLGVPERHWEHLPDGMPVVLGGDPQGTVSAAEIAHHHVWVGGFLGRRGIHVSNQLYERLTREKVRYLKFSPLVESELEWRPDEQIGPVMRWLEADPARIRHLVQTRPDWVLRHRPAWLKLAN